MRARGSFMRLINISLKMKVIVLGTVSVAGLVIIFLSTGFTQSIIRGLIDDKQAVANLKNHMLTLRKHEKDFLLRLDMKYPELFQAGYASMQEPLKTITGHNEADETVEMLAQTLEHYKESFDKLVKLQQEIGLNEKEGYYGALRSSVHNAESLLGEMNLTEASRNMLMLRRREKDFMLRRDIKYRASFLEDFAKYTDSLRQSISDDAALSRILGLSESYKRDFLALVDKESEKGLTHEDGLQKELRDASEKSEALMNTATGIINQKISESRSRFALVNSVIIFAISAVIIMFLTALLINIISLTRKLTATTKKLMHFGNLTEDDAKVSSNCEITKANLMLEVFQQKVFDAVNTVKLSSASVSSGSTQLASVSEELSATMGDQAEQITSVAGATEQISISSGEVLNALREANEQTENASRLTGEGKSKLLTSVNEVMAIKERVEKLGDTIGKLSESSEEIGNIVSVINDIADQTNLLALNAAIEAARAGENGRGFAVVADEVRKLAERTQTATKEIEEIISSLQRETDTANRDMSEANSKVETGAESIKDTEEIFEHIVSSVVTIKNTNEIMTSSIREQVTAITNINENTQVISSGIDESSSAVAEISKTVADLQKQADELNTMVERFNTD